MSKHHTLKLRDEFCDAVYAGDKSFEVRKNDRGYQKGDTVNFICVTEDGTQLPHFIIDKTYEITYVLSGWGIKEDYVVFGIKEIENENRH